MPTQKQTPAQPTPPRTTPARLNPNGNGHRPKPSKPVVFTDFASI